MTVSVRLPCDDAAIRSAPDVAPCSRRLGRSVLAASILGSSMAFVDGTIVNVALPVLQAELEATVAGLQWVVEAYALLLSALLLVGGMLGDRLGQRRIFASGIVLFTAASLWCGLAPDMLQLILARAVQGIGGALLVPGSLALISAHFSAGQRGRAIGTWSAFTALAMAFGPVLGGWLVDNLSWRWVFLLNVPVAAATLFILYRGVPETATPAKPQRLDWGGAVLATLALGGVVYALVESGRIGLASWPVAGALAAGLLAAAAFLLVEARGEAPMVPLGLFRSRAFSGANLITLPLYAALGGGLFFLPFNLIQVQGYSATAAGAAFLPFVAIMFALSRWSGGLVDRFGGRPPLIIGPLVAAAGFVLLALPGIGGGYWRTFMPGIVVLGLGMAITVAPLTTVVMSAVDDKRAGIASGINNAVSRVAGLLAVALIGVFVLAAFNNALDGAIATLDLPAQARQELAGERIRLAGAAAPPGLDVATRTALEAAIDGAFVTGFRVAMAISAALAVSAAAVATLMIDGGSGPVRTNRIML